MAIFSLMSHFLTPSGVLLLPGYFQRLFPQLEPFSAQKPNPFGVTRVQMEVTVVRRRLCYPGGHL